MVFQTNFNRSLVVLWASLTLLICPYLDAEGIRLRSGAVVTSSKPAAKAAAANARGGGKNVASGLYLIQLESAIQQAWRSELKTKGVHLIRFVPEDAFIARLNRVSVEEILELDFVRWVGPYRPKQKMDPRFDRVLAKGGVAAEIDVSVVMVLGTFTG